MCPVKTFRLFSWFLCMELLTLDSTVACEWPPSLHVGLDKQPWEWVQRALLTWLGGTQHMLHWDPGHTRNCGLVPRKAFLEQKG